MNPLRRRRKVLDMAVCVAVAALTALFVAAHVHGYLRDFYDDGLHARGTCLACGFYRWSKMDDAAFQARELRRASK
jgi:hypothetical protein